MTVAEKTYKRLKNSSEHLTQGSASPASSNITQNTREVEIRFLAIMQSYNSVKTNMVEKQLLHSSFNKLEEELESWLTEIEVRMISLQPYTSEKEHSEQVDELKKLNKELKDHSYLLHELNDVSKKVEGENISRHGIVEELNERYKQVILLTGFFFTYILSNQNKHFKEPINS